jgi:hypothetical protein
MQNVQHIRTCQLDALVAASRSAAANHIGAELPVQYSALTSLQSWCVAPDPV